MDYSLERKKTPDVVRASLMVAAPTTGGKQSAVVNGKQSAGVPSGKQAAATPKPKYQGKKYTEKDIMDLLGEGYINIHKSLYDYIPVGAHVRYVKKDTGAGLPRHERFKPGGFLRNHFVNAEGRKMFMLENKPGGTKESGQYVSFPVAHEDVDELWKKYDRNAFIEIHLIYTSLAQKKKEISDLTARVTTLENILKGLVGK